MTFLGNDQSRFISCFLPTGEERSRDLEERVGIQRIPGEHASESPQVSIYVSSK